jgi:hypothetical protein
MELSHSSKVIWHHLPINRMLKSEPQSTLRIAKEFLSCFTFQKSNALGALGGYLSLGIAT